MDSERWQTLNRLFEEVVVADPTDQDAILRRVREGDTDLAAELEALLDADQAAADEDLRRRVTGASIELDTDHQGRRIGAYRVIREEGRGGMGRVFVGERADGHFDQTVAIKVLHSQFASEALRERFRQERQILARLQHPNIAMLLDGGLTEEGSPFFALEYVDGEPIDAYCDRRGLDVEERLGLFRQVCDALVYAHANLVVHRDLKPDNILATEDGQVHLLDFGIAKVLAEDDDLPARTRTAMWAMTPAYASPEQVRGEPVGTATDVYSLGVILYRLLTGVLPYELDARSPTSIERTVCETEPVRPSTRIGKDLSTDPGAVRAIAERRATDPSRLRRTLSGDLDVICMKALRKEPERRYGSVQALLDDITWYLEGRPVRARPTTIAYRVGKAIRRNAWAVGAAAALVVTTTGLVAFYTARLAAERDVAQLEAAKAQEVSAFLQSLFAVSDPDASRGETVTARELLDEGASRIATELDGQPEVQATMLQVISEVYASLGMASTALPLIDRTLELSHSVHGPLHEDVGWALLIRATVLQDLGRLDEAGPAFREAVATLESALGPEDPMVAQAREEYAYWLLTDGAYEEAEAEYRIALGHLRATVGPDDPRLISVVASLGRLLRQVGEEEAAEPLLREALTKQRVLYGNRHTEVASTARNLAALLRDQDRYEESDSLYREVLSIRRELFGDVHPEVAGALNSYAILLSLMGEGDRAIAAYREFLAIIEGIHDGPHPSLAVAYHNVAMELSDMGRAEEAVEHFRRSMEIQDEVFRPGHPNRAFPRVGLATAYRNLSRPELAEPLLRETLAIRRAELPEGHRYTGEALSDLGETLMDLGRHAEAEPLLLEAYTMLEAGEGPDAGRTQTARRRLARLYSETGDSVRAARYASVQGTAPAGEEQPPEPPS